MREEGGLDEREKVRRREGKEVEERTNSRRSSARRESKVSFENYEKGERGIETHCTSYPSKTEKGSVRGTQTAAGREEGGGGSEMGTARASASLSLLSSSLVKSTHDIAYQGRKRGKRKGVSWGLRESCGWVGRRSDSKLARLTPSKSKVETGERRREEGLDDHLRRLYKTKMYPGARKSKATAATKCQVCSTSLLWTTRGQEGERDDGERRRAPSPSSLLVLRFVPSTLLSRASPKRIYSLTHTPLLALCPIQKCLHTGRTSPSLPLRPSPPPRSPSLHLQAHPFSYLPPRVFRLHLRMQERPSLRRPTYSNPAARQAQQEGETEC